MEVFKIKLMSVNDRLKEIGRRQYTEDNMDQTNTLNSRLFKLKR